MDCCCFHISLFMWVQAFVFACVSYEYIGCVHVCVYKDDLYIGNL